MIRARAGHGIWLANGKPRGGSTVASGKSDEAKGRVKEAAGTLTGDKRLRRKGKVGQAAGKLKQKVEKAIDKLKRTVS